MAGPVMDVFVRLLDEGPTALLGYRLRTGHRLRLHVASSDFPEYLPQPGTGASPWIATDVVTNTQALNIGGHDAACFGSRT